MKQFKVKAVGTEMLAEKIIEAATRDEAEIKYFDLWTAGRISAFDYAMEYTTTEINEAGEGEADE